MKIIIKSLTFILGIVLLSAYIISFIAPLRSIVEAYEPSLVLVNVSVFQRHGASENNLIVNHEAYVQSKFVSLAAEEEKIKITYIVLIKDDHDFTVNLTWTEKVLGKDDLTASISWIPEKTGMYAIDVFVWNDLATPVPITNTMNLPATVIER